MALLIEATVGHLRSRQQFGRPLAEFQVLQHRVADMYIAFERAQAVASMALREGFARGLSILERTVSAAKYKVGTAARYVSCQAVQLHGGMGVSNDHLVAHGFRRISAIEASYGNSEFHLERYRRNGGNA